MGIETHPLVRLQSTPSVFECIGSDLSEKILSCLPSEEFPHVVGVNRYLSLLVKKELYQRQRVLELGPRADIKKIRNKITKLTKQQLSAGFQQSLLTHNRHTWEQLRKNIVIQLYFPAPKKSYVPFSQPVDSPQLHFLIQSMENDYRLFIDSPEQLRDRVKVLEREELGVKNEAYIYKLSKGIFNMWKELANDNRIVKYMPDDISYLYKPSLRSLAKKMEKHYAYFGGNANIFLNNGRKDIVYFGNLATAIKQIPLPRRSCCLKVNDSFSRDENEPRAEISCRVLVSCATPSPLFGLTANTALGCTFGSITTLGCCVVSLVGFNCVLPLVAGREKEARDLLSDVKKSPDPEDIHASHLLAPPAPPNKSLDSI